MTPSNVYEEAMKRFTIDLQEGRVFWGRRPRSDFLTVGRHIAWEQRYLGKEVGYRNGTRGGLGVHFMGHNITLARLVARKKFGRKVYGFLIGYKDGDAMNIRADNLYLTTATERRLNAAPTKNRKGDGLPVGIYKRSGKYEAYRRVAGKLQYLGRFDELPDAVNARAAARLLGRKK